MLLIIKKFAFDILKNFHKKFYFRSLFCLLRDHNTFYYNGILLDIPICVCPPSMRLRFINESYEYPEFFLIKKYMSKSDTFIELGGCIGFISCVASKISKSNNNKVFEINPYLTETIKYNLSNNKCNTSVIHGAITNKKTFLLNSSKMTTSKICYDHGVEIPSYKMCDVNIHNANTLILDVEGAEYDIFRFQDLSSFSKIFVEWHDISKDDNISNGRIILERLGFLLIENIHMTDFFKR